MPTNQTIDDAIEYHQNGQLDKAIVIYRALLQEKQDNQLIPSLLSNIAQCYFQFAQILMQMGRNVDAIKTFENILTIRTDVPDVHFLLGKLFVASGNKPRAAECLRNYLNLDPDDKAGAIMFLAHIGEEEIPDKPALPYLKNFYDSYAVNYDEYLINRLSYKCPDIILDSMKKQHISNVDVLDLGCGTGLCGVAIKSITRSLVGVDLSQPMLAVASQRSMYDNLADSDIYEFMSQKQNQYDVIVAAGLFEHIGTTEPLFSATLKALRNNGYFIFTCEENIDGDLGVNKSGYYMHGRSHLEQQAIDCGFEVVAVDNVAMWIENNQPMSGLSVTLRKPD